MEYSKREIIIALVATGVLISICVVGAGAAYWYMIGHDADGPGASAGGIPDPSEGQTQEESDENQNENTANAGVGGGFQDSYLFTNPVESLSCLGGSIFLLIAIIGIDYYLKHRTG
ncbi:MAG: hypothetical protein MUO76_03715 [Anaerolineaceae bacterium]|nr:hypothetical protein [Anaerolineaceae bacterium]